MEEKIATLKERIRGGVVPALATPLMGDGRHINLDVVPALIEFLIDKGVAGFFVGGTTGEGLMLAADERRRYHDCVMKVVDGRRPVLLHVGANTTETSLSLAEHAAGLNPAAIAVITPTFYGLTDDALHAHFHQVAAVAPNVPLFVYDIPHMAVNGVSPALLQRLGETLPSLAGIKTSRGDAQVVRQLIDVAPERSAIMAGNERIALGLLAMGADGLVSGLATAVPEPFVTLTAAVSRGDLDQARRAQRCINQLLDRLPAGERMGALKLILAERGVPVGPVVPPRTMPVGPLWPELAPLVTGLAG